jgi:hypothetical protein
MLRMFCILEVVQLSGCKQLTQMHAGQHLDRVIPSSSILHGEILVVASPART